MRLPAWRPRSEVELCAALVAHYKAQGWTVYQEVVLDGGGRADLVLARGGALRIVEAKRAFTGALLAQAQWWRRGVCEAVYVAVPVRVAPQRLARLNGLGFIRVLGPRAVDVHEVVQPAPLPFPVGYSGLLRRALGPHLVGRGTAGAPHSDFYSPFAHLRAQLDMLVRAHPGLTPRAAAAAIEHRFISDEECARRILAWARNGRLRGHVYAALGPRRRYGLHRDRRDWSTRSKLEHPPSDAS